MALSACAFVVYACTCTIRDRLYLDRALTGLDYLKMPSECEHGPYPVISVTMANKEYDLTPGAPTITLTSPAARGAWW
jgi:hypothetical protein